MKEKFLMYFFVLLSFYTLGQTSELNTFQNQDLVKQLEALRQNNKITADSAWSILTTWNKFPEIKQVNRYYLFVYKDSVFGEVPVKVFIPKNYRKDIPSPAIMILHGAVVLSSFKDAYKKDTLSDEDIFYKFYKEKNFIIIRPFADGFGPHADGTKNFDWVVNRHKGMPNPTFQSLDKILAALKLIININDNKLFAMGHSDGSDGAFMLAVSKPSIFAGFIIYNSMLTNIHARNIYLKNIQNRPVYLMHSSLDHLRPIEQTRKIAHILDTLSSLLLYKEYTGYKHYDKHLQKDLPYSYHWLEGTSRNPFAKGVYWEASDNLYNACDWLNIFQIDTTRTNTNWHIPVNTVSYNKIDKKFESDLYYPGMLKGAAVSASYHNNTFYIKTSRTKEVEILIDPTMVNLENPVNVYLNGKLAYQKKVFADKNFLLNNFKKNLDRHSVWVCSIKLKCEY